MVRGTAVSLDRTVEYISFVDIFVIVSFKNVAICQIYGISELLKLILFEIVACLVIIFVYQLCYKFLFKSLILGLTSCLLSFFFFIDL